MITIEQLKDWGNSQAREQLEQLIENYIDEDIKQNVLDGNLKFSINTGMPNNYANRAQATQFFYLWCSQEVSRDNLEIVRENILGKYRELGLIIKKEMFDCGWNSNYEGISIKIPKELLKEDND